MNSAEKSHGSDSFTDPCVVFKSNHFTPTNL